MFDRKQSVPRRNVVKFAFAWSFVVTFVLVTARLAGVLPMPSDLPPGGVIALCLGLSAALLASCVWYFKRTDEHDLNANLWSLSWAWIGGALLTLDWLFLHEAGLVRPPRCLADPAGQFDRRRGGVAVAAVSLGGRH